MGDPGSPGTGGKIFMKVVCDTSSLILLSKIRRLDLLAELYDEVTIPASVMDEVEAKPGEGMKRIRDLLQSPKFRLRKALKRTLERLPAGLGKGLIGRRDYRRSH